MTLPKSEVKHTGKIGKLKNDVTKMNSFVSVYPCTRVRIYFWSAL